MVVLLGPQNEAGQAQGALFPLDDRFASEEACMEAGRALSRDMYFLLPYCKAVEETPVSQYYVYD